MARGKQREIPPALARGRDRFTAWRRTRRPKSRIPEALWELAVRLASTHGLHPTARALKLDYYSLKKRVAAAAQGQKNATAFLELPPAIRLRAHLKGFSAAEIATVGRVFRDAS